MNQFMTQPQNSLYGGYSRPNPYTTLPNYTNPYTAAANVISGINWVQGTEAAKAYQMTPNSNVVLFDSENDGLMYIKTCDAIGMCELKIFKIEEITKNENNPQKNVDMSEYVTKDELNEILSKMSGGADNGKSVVSTATKGNTKSKNAAE